MNTREFCSVCLVALHYAIFFFFIENYFQVYKNKLNN